MGLALTAPLEAQFLDPDSCWTCASSRQHFAAGAVIDLAWRPLLRPGLNRPIPRVLLTTAVGAIYEGMDYVEARVNGKLGRRGYGFGLIDLTLDVAGAVLVELVDGVFR